jgi:hypothetical protein
LKRSLERAVFARDGRWVAAGGGSGTGITWTSLSDEGETGVLRFGDEAPRDVSKARLRYEGQEHEVPVRHGHFLFVAWNTDFDEDPQIVAFD